MRVERLGWALRLSAGPVACLAVVALLLGLAAGCGGQPDPQAGELIQESNRHLAKAAAEVKNLSEFNTQWSTIVSGQANKEAATQVKTLLEKARKQEQAALAEVKAAGTAVARIKDLDVSGEMKTYAEMKLAALEEQEKVLTTELEAMALRLQAIDGFVAGDTVEAILMTEKKITLLEEESRQSAKQANELHKQANAYFKEKKLGE